MSKIKSLKKDAVFLQDLKYLTEAYEEIAVMKMKKIREAILSARKFTEKLTDVFFDVKTSYKKAVEKLLEGKNKKEKMKAKKLAILISPDNRLYGDLTTKVFELFQKNLKNYHEAIIIGKTGINFAKQKNLKQIKLTFINTFSLSNENLKTLAKKFTEFEKIDVYHPRFENLLIQIPNTTNISGDKPEPLTQEKETNKKMGFLVEPSIEEVFDFFKTQALLSIFKSTLGESELALLAARIKAMERAIEQVDKNLEEISKKILREQRLERDKKQLEQLAGISLWQTNY